MDRVVKNFITNINTTIANTKMDEQNYADTLKKLNLAAKNTKELVDKLERAGK